MRNLIEKISFLGVTKFEFFSIFQFLNSGKKTRTVSLYIPKFRLQEKLILG